MEPSAQAPTLVVLPGRPSPADVVGSGMRVVVEPAAARTKTRRGHALLVSHDGRVYLRDAAGMRGPIASALSADARLTLEANGQRVEALALPVSSPEECRSVSCAYIQRFGYRAGAADLLRPDAVEATFEVLARPSGRAVER